MEKKPLRPSERPISPARSSNLIRNSAKTNSGKEKESKNELPKTDSFMIKKPNDTWDY